MIVCPSPKCGSPNVADLPHYWRSLPSDSDLKAKYAPPAAARGGLLGALGALVFGIVVAVGGAVLLGLVIAAGGLGWGAVVYKATTYAEERRTTWESSRVCLACTGRF
ncbi:hypothetical protein ACIBAC_07220 [Streptomyces sp. NPDC051362]|uniref:hypothetical protein n=1 Tax=Streptomyces sp. NPDC051362 TaxID=3365651 RepID=UPI00379A2D32